MKTLSLLTLLIAMAALWPEDANGKMRYSRTLDRLLGSSKSHVPQSLSSRPLPGTGRTSRLLIHLANILPFHARPRLLRSAMRRRTRDLGFGNGFFSSPKAFPVYCVPDDNSAGYQIITKRQFGEFKDPIHVPSDYKKPREQVGFGSWGAGTLENEQLGASYVSCDQLLKQGLVGIPLVQSSTKAHRSETGEDAWGNTNQWDDSGVWGDPVDPSGSTGSSDTGLPGSWGSGPIENEGIIMETGESNSSPVDGFTGFSSPTNDMNWGSFEVQPSYHSSSDSAGDSSHGNWGSMDLSSKTGDSWGAIKSNDGWGSVPISSKRLKQQGSRDKVRSVRTRLFSKRKSA